MWCFLQKEIPHIMSKKKTHYYLFNEPETTVAQSLLLLVARIIFGFMFMSHGIAKWIMFNNATETFPDPIGLGATLSFWLAIFAEILCAFGFILGALFRLSLIPMIFTMCVALLFVHAGDPLSKMEPAITYLTIFGLMFFSGPGDFSVDVIMKKMK